MVAVVQPPPRRTGNLTVDAESYAEWFAHVYEVGIIGNQFWKETGSITISGPDTSGEVTFANAQPDTDFIVFTQAYGITGSPDVDSYSARVSSQSTTGCTISLAAAPGAGAGVTFNWSLMRSIT